ncbi:MAG: hypothetical protein WC455_20720 [Dehalococcoidia bacterium]
MRRLFYWIFRKPLEVLAKIWNPGGRIKHRHSGHTVHDRRARKRSAINSQAERQRRLDAGEPEQKWHSRKAIKSVDISGGGN